MRRATVQRVNGRAYWNVTLFQSDRTELTQGRVKFDNFHWWPMACPTWTQAMKAAERWTRGLHAIPCCPRCERMGR